MAFRATMKPRNVYTAPSWRKFDGHRHRSWPLSGFFLGILLLLVLLPQIAYKISLEKEDMLRRRTIFGDNLEPTPWHWHVNPFAPIDFNWDRSVEIKKCSIHSWLLPNPRPLRHLSQKKQNATSCPSYFQWIRSDLAPWEKTGITRSNIEMAKEHAAFRVVIVDGELYIDSYYSCVQTRALFTVWGLLLLLEKYKGHVPNVDLMFDCMDRPHIEKVESSTGLSSPPILFRYCSTPNHFDIPFPDWSFWGWTETQLKPWDQERENILRASEKQPWAEKVKKAFWRGNPDVGSPLRMELLKCNNGSRKFPSRAEIQNQNWDVELASGAKNSRLEDQCTHRYKIYSEGFAWSVSFKYIMACGSTTLAISPAYHDFFMRGLEPWVHYVPVRPTEICANKLCSAINSAVKWGEANTQKAEAIGRAGQEFVRNELDMNNVYDYIYHLLVEYAGLQTFKPTIPATAQKYSQNFLLCLAQPHQRRFLKEARQFMSLGSTPCQMPESAGNVKDFQWEAKEHSSSDWSQRKCKSRRRKTGTRKTQRHDTSLNATSTRSG